MDFLTLEDVLFAHEDQIARYGEDHSLRDAGLQDSAIAQPGATFAGTFLYAFPFEMAAAYLFHFVQNYPLQ
jgi:death-on-curing protein